MRFQPYSVQIAQSALDELQARLARIRWPDELPGVDWRYGVPLNYVERLTDYWRNGYDWRKWEARVNAYPQFTTEFDAQNIHFLHIRSPEPNAMPLIVSHGWPGSIFEFLDIVGPLTDPRSHGADPADAFDLVIPSLPGFGFSGPTHESGWNPDRIARAWIALMHGLGYERYAAIGNDWGSFISPQVGRFDPGNVAGVHVTQIFLDPSGDPDELASFTPDDLRALEKLKWGDENMGAYSVFQSQQPQTLAFALTDSPVGWLAWTCQIFRDGIDDEFVLTNANLYWLTDTIASSLRIYYENAHAALHSEPTTTPIGLAMFPDDYGSFPTLAKRAHRNLIRWSEFDTGGHFAAHQVPELLVTDVRTFFRSLRG